MQPKPSLTKCVAGNARRIHPEIARAGLRRATAVCVAGLSIGVAPAAFADTYHAQIIRTSNGIPHISGETYGDVGYGYGYAFAEDNLCTMADIYVTVNGERSRYFGPDGSWSFNGNGTRANNLNSDFFYTRINDSRIIEDLRDGSEVGPALPAEGLALIEGYVAGYNRFLSDYRAATPGTFIVHDCADEEWVRPITTDDAFRRFFQLASLASAGVAINETGSAQPPHPSAPGASSGASDQKIIDGIIEGIPSRLSEALGIGSNAYGVGSELTSNGRGLVLGNPHFPWHGGERLYQSHLTVTGPDPDAPPRMNVSGASLYGVPLINIGHTDGLAWSHTVSTAYRFTPFELTLVPGSPTTYLVDGEPREMIAREVTVSLPDGSTASRTLYETEYGPMITGVLGLPIFPWTPVKAFAMGDANAHLRYLNHFFDKNHAQSTEELYEIQKKYVGIPWVNTMAADSAGRAYYGDISSVPHVTDAHAQRCNTVVGAAAFAALGLPVLDGSRSECNWGTDPSAPLDENGNPVAGIFGHESLPHLFRDDYVLNSNDSYWLTNPAAPITGYARIIGDEESARSLRTRLGLVMIEEVKAGTSEYGDRLDRPEMMDLVFNNRQYAAELTLPDVVAMCREMNGVFPNDKSGVERDEGGEACDALEGFNGQDDLDSNGAVLFRRFWTRADDSPAIWVNQFDVNDPVRTPNTLNTLDPVVRGALGGSIADLRGVRDIEGNPVPLNAPLRGLQYERRAGGSSEAIDIHGGPGSLGVFNAINVGWSSSTGYSDVAHGSSFVMVAQFVDPGENGGCGVDASAIVTYSQSENPRSPWFADQTKMFSNKVWNGMHFCADEIEADKVSVTTISSE